MGHRHESHPDIIKRLTRASGHLKKTIAMIEEGRSCVEVAQQLQAVHSAIGNAKRVYVQDHIEGCLGNKEASAKLRKQVQELKEISKYL